MRTLLAVSCLLALAMSLHGCEAASPYFLCKPFTAAKGDMIRTLHEDRSDLFGDAVAYVDIIYKGVNDAGAPQFRDEITVVRTPTPETTWKNDDIYEQQRRYEIGVSESRVVDRTMPTKPLVLRALAVMDNGDLRYQWELPGGCDY